MRVLWSLTRRSATLWAGLVVAAVEVWLALTSQLPGLNLWPDLVSGLSVATIYTGVIAAGFSAFEASRWSAVTIEHGRTSARTPALIRLLHATIAAIPILAGYLLALAILAVFATSTGTYGAPSVAWLVAIGCALFAASTFGWILGTIGGGRWWVSPAAAVLFFGAYILVRILPLPNGIKALYPVVVAQDFVFTRPVLPTLLGTAAFVTGAAVLALLLIGRGWRPTTRRPLLAVAIVSGIIAISGATAAGLDGRYVEGISARDQEVCNSRSIEICINRGYAAALTPLHEQFASMNRKVTGTPLAATRLEQGIAGGPSVRPGFRRFDVYQLRDHADITGSVSSYVEEHGTSQAACQDRDAGYSEARMYVTAWLSGYEGWYGDPADISRYRALQALTPAKGNQWFRQHYRQYFTCTLQLDDLP